MIRASDSTYHTWLERGQHQVSSGDDKDTYKHTQIQIQGQRQRQSQTQMIGESPRLDEIRRMEIFAVLSSEVGRLRDDFGSLQAAISKILLTLAENCRFSQRRTLCVEFFPINIFDLTIATESTDKFKSFFYFVISF